MCLRSQGHGLAPCGLGASLRCLPAAASPVTCLLRRAQKLARAPNRGERQVPLQPKQVAPNAPTWVPAAAEGDGTWATEKGYQLTSAVFLVFGVFILVKPGKAAELSCKACMTEVPKHLLRILGAQLLLAATFSYHLQAAVGAGTLGNESNQRMAGALSLERIGNAVCKYLAAKNGLAMSTAFLVYSYGSAALLTALYFLSYSRLPIGLSLLNNAWASLKALVQPKNRVALGYSAIAGVAILGLADCLCCGWYTSKTLLAWGKAVEFGTTGKLLVKTVGLGLAYVAVAAFNLREAAEVGSLSSEESKTTNLGLFAAMAAIGATQGWYAYTNNVNPALGAAFAALVVLYSGYHYVNE